jgi:hypothetical protein
MKGSAVIIVREAQSSLAGGAAPVAVDAKAASTQHPARIVFMFALRRDGIAFDPMDARDAVGT